MGSTITSSVTLGKAVPRDEPWSYRTVRGIPISVLHQPTVRPWGGHLTSLSLRCVSSYLVAEVRIYRGKLLDSGWHAVLTKCYLEPSVRRVLHLCFLP